MYKDTENIQIVDGNSNERENVYFGDVRHNN
jgi:hypothetical protein